MSLVVADHPTVTRVAAKGLTSNWGRENIVYCSACGYETKMAEPQRTVANSWEPSLKVLQRVRVKYGDRALHQFAVACCRRIWHLLSDPRSRAAVEVAERYHSGLAEIEEVDLARAGAWEARDLASSSDEPSIFRGVKEAHAKAAACVIDMDPPEDGQARFGYAEDDALWVLVYAAWATAHAKWLADTKLPWEIWTVDWDVEHEKEREVQHRLLKEYFGDVGSDLP